MEASSALPVLPGFPEKAERSSRSARLLRPVPVPPASSGDEDEGQRCLLSADKGMKGAVHIAPPEREKRSEAVRNQLPTIREIMIESLCRGTLLFPPSAYLKAIKDFFEMGDF